MDGRLRLADEAFPRVLRSLDQYVYTDANIKIMSTSVCIAKHKSARPVAPVSSGQNPLLSSKQLRVTGRRCADEKVEPSGEKLPRVSSGPRATVCTSLALPEKCCTSRPLEIVNYFGAFLE